METLVAMGFVEADCAAALAQASDDVEAALNLLLGGFTAPAGAGSGAPEDPMAASRRQLAAAQAAAQQHVVSGEGDRASVIAGIEDERHQWSCHRRPARIHD